MPTYCVFSRVSCILLALGPSHPGVLAIWKQAYIHCLGEIETGISEIAWEWATTLIEVRPSYYQFWKYLDDDDSWDVP